MTHRRWQEDKWNVRDTGVKFIEKCSPEIWNITLSKQMLKNNPNHPSLNPLRFDLILKIK